MIVKDEERFLEGALASAVDKVDEVVVVDTGSADRTIAIAEQFGAKVRHFAWTDSFSDARNESLRHVTGQWVIILDADERLGGDGWPEFRRFLSTTDTSEVLALSYVNRTLSGQATSSVYAPRMFRNDGRTVYRGRVHNRIELRAQPGRHRDFQIVRGPAIDHYGYDRDVYAQKAKSARSLPLIEAELRERPGDPRYRYYRARELINLDRNEAGRDALEALVCELLEREPQDPVLLLDAATVWFVGLHRAGDTPRSSELIEQLRGRFPDHPDVRLAEARAWARRGRFEAALEAARAAQAALTTSAVNLGNELVRHQPWRVHELTGEVALELGRHGEAFRAFVAALQSKPDQGGGWSKLLTSLAGLAIALGHRALAEEVLVNLAARPDCDPAMLYFEVERRAREESTADAASLLERALTTAPRLLDADEVRALRAKVGAAARAADAVSK